MDLKLRTGKFIEKENLFHKKSRLLLAVSGGVDSVVMANVLLELGYSVGIAHVNYGLRGADADEDAGFVSDFASENELAFHLLTLEKSQIADLKEGNLQAKARKLRYDFFNGMILKEPYDFLCTAHNANDRSETFLLQSVRVSGTRGLSSIQVINENIRRPLLFAKREDIEIYAEKNDIDFRKDLSNEENYYDRNFLRNEVFPAIQNRWSNIHDRLNKTCDLVSNEQMLLSYLVNREIEKWVDHRENELVIKEMDELRKIPGRVTFLHYILGPYGFSVHDIGDMLDQHISGAIFHSATHSALFDRNQLILRPKLFLDKDEVIIEAPGTFRFSNGQSLEINKVSDFLKTGDRDIEIIDADDLNYPLLIRSWQIGDYFYPLGMGGKRKKLSDLFADHKLSQFEKEEVKILCSGTRIIWVLGLRLDDRIKVTDKTKNYIKLSYSRL